MLYVIEHLEPEMYKWCLLEYRRIAEIVGSKNLAVTNLRGLNVPRNITKNSNKKSFRKIGLKGVCLLSPYANKRLSKNDGNRFECLVFGGILGDNPPRKRTMKYFNGIKCEKRNLGKKQMSTDTAVYVAKKVIDGKSMKDLDFVDNIEVKMDKYLSVHLPFRYVRVRGRILIPKGMKKLLRDMEMP